MALCSDEAVGPGYGAVNVGLRKEQPTFEVLVGKNGQQHKSGYRGVGGGSFTLSFL